MRILQPDDTMPFGKCKGEILKEIYQFNPHYLEWLVKFTDGFLIDINNFKLLPTPTPFIVEEKEEKSNLLWINVRANFVIAAKSFLHTGGIIPEKEFNFSDEIIQILEQKRQGLYKAPPYPYVSNMDEGDFA